MLQKGFKLSGGEKGIYLKKSNVTYSFNKKIKSGEGQLVGMKILKRTDEIAAIGMDQRTPYWDIRAISLQSQLLQN